MEQECIFCKIIRGEIPAYKIYEDENVVAILDINPVSEGHTLVIPKKHYNRVSEMPSDELKEFFSSVQKVIKIIEGSLSRDYNIIINQGKLAGQEINHLHVHIIPRYGNEQLFMWITHKLSEEEAKKVIDKIKSKF